MSTHTVDRPEESTLDLDTRIALAEERLMVRDMALQLELRSLQSRAAEAFKPANLLHSAGKALGVGGGAALAALAAVWVWRGRRPSLATGSATTDAAGRDDPIGSGSMFSLAGLVGLGWPLMPERIRALVSPGAARMLVTLGAPVLSQLFRSRSAAPLATMTAVDPTRFAGNWFAVAHLPLRLADACDGLSTVRYAMKRPGEYKVTVRCPAKADRSGGRVRSLRGVARLVSGSGGGKLKLSVWPRGLRWLPLAWSDHWILHLDSDYSEAVVGSPGRDALWLLSRTGYLPPHRLEYLLTMARDDGFPIDKLHFAEGGEVDPGPRS